MTRRLEQRPGSIRRTWLARILPGPWRHAGVLAMALAISSFLLVGGAAGQKQNKNDKKSPQDIDIRLPMPDAQAIDLMIAQMLGAWQVGDVEMMRKFYADDLTMVSGAWEQPLFGWANYLRAYQAQRARVQGGRLDRRNTYTKVMGDMAWSTYQWAFTGQVDGKPVDAFGHTTLVLQKRAGNWIIVMNHTSSVSSPEPTAPATAVPQPSGAAPSPGD